MDAFLAQFGLTFNDLINVVAVIVILLVVLGILRTIFRWTRTVFRIGCFGVFVIGGIMLYLLYVNPI